MACRIARKSGQSNVARSGIRFQYAAHSQRSEPARQSVNPRRDGGSPATNLNIFKNCNDEEVQIRVPPTHNGSGRFCSGCIQWPKYSHQPIVCNHTSLKTSLDAGAVRGQKSRRLGTEDARSISCVSKWRSAGVRADLGGLSRSNSLNRYDKKKEKYGENSKSSRKTTLDSNTDQYQRLVGICSVPTYPRFAQGLTTTPCSQAKMHRSIPLVTRSHLAVM